MLVRLKRRWNVWLGLAVLGCIPWSVAQAQQGTKAKVRVLAEQTVDGLAGQSLTWIAERVTTAVPLTHVHERGFVYAADAAQSVQTGAQTTTVAPGTAAVISTDLHTHGAGTYIEFRLAAPGSPLLAHSTRLFATSPLQGIPAGTATVRLLEIVLPPHGGATPVHTHPGPEVILAHKGRIEYQSTLHGIEHLQAGDMRALPARTTVQKRNPHAEEAAFLGLFIVDPAQGFAPDASFAVDPHAGNAPHNLPRTLPATGGTDRRWLLLSVLGCMLLVGGRRLRKQHWTTEQENRHRPLDS
ncbi:MAG: hypothetical protein NVSMB42_21060 [Herpetosiphon sp.]